MTHPFKSLNKYLFLIMVFLLVPGGLAHAEGIGVAIFSVNGPKDMAYLSTAAQDAVLGSLLKKGRSAKALLLVVEPDRLKAEQVKKSGMDLVVTGRINVVGDTYRVLLKWMRPDGSGDQDYLEVGNLNQLLPQLEGFARVRLEPLAVAAAPAPLAPPPVASVPPAVIPPPAPKEEIPKVAEKAPTPAPKVAAVAPPAPEAFLEPKLEAPKPSKKEEKQEKKSEQKKELSREALARKIQEADAHGFSYISQRLPYEVRALAYGDADGDGQAEVVLTGQSDLFVYRLQPDGQLQEIARYSGKKLDNFVKVSIWSRSPDKPLIVLTNLRGDGAASHLLTLQGGSLQSQTKDIPFQLRVATQGTRVMLLGEAYHAKGNQRHQVYEMEVLGSKLRPGKKVELPAEADLFSFEWIPAETGNGWDVAYLSPSGKLKFFRQAGDKYKRVWTSRETYGGSANDVAVEVVDMFNEVVADYYVVPIGLEALSDNSGPELVLAKNDMLLKEIVGRKPLATDGKMVRLRWDQLGFSETWISKKVDGSILDYLVTPALAKAPAETPPSVSPRSKKSGASKHKSDLDEADSSAAAVAPAGKQLLVAVRVRDQGFWEGVGRKDSVLLVYDLN